MKLVKLNKDVSTKKSKAILLFVYSLELESVSVVVVSV